MAPLISYSSSATAWAVGQPPWSADHGPAPLSLSFGADAQQWALLSLDAGMAHFELVCFSSGLSNLCDARVAASDWTASCSLAKKGLITLHFQQKPAIIEI